MNILTMIIVAGFTFGLVYLIDKGFQKLFRNKKQHKSGLAVKLTKQYGVFGVVGTVLGIAAMIAGLSDGPVLLIGGIVVVALGLALGIYYLSFGIYYDEDSFVCQSMGKETSTYRFSDIQGQRLYLITGGSTLVELHLADGKTVSLQSTMDGMYPFLDAAFSAWCRQKGIDPDSCQFHDPSQSLWFPTLEE